MSKNNDHITFIPVRSFFQQSALANTNPLQTTFRECPPTKLIGQEDGRDVYRWYITEDEYLRLTKLFGRDFQETGVGGTLVLGLPSQCTGCKKYTEFIDWSIVLSIFIYSELKLLTGSGLHFTAGYIRPVSCFKL